MRSALLALAAGAVLFALAFSGANSDPVIGDWKGDSLLAHHVINLAGAVTDVVEPVPDATLDYHPAHIAIWSTGLAGPWSKKNGRYRVKLSKAYGQSLEDSLPSDVKLKKARLDLFDGQVLGDLHLTSLKFKSKIAKGGAIGKLKGLGTFAGARQP